MGSSASVCAPCCGNEDDVLNNDNVNDDPFVLPTQQLPPLPAYSKYGLAFGSSRPTQAIMIPRRAASPHPVSPVYRQANMTAAAPGRLGRPGVSVFYTQRSPYEGVIPGAPPTSQTPPPPAMSPLHWITPGFPVALPQLPPPKLPPRQTPVPIPLTFAPAPPHPASHNRSRSAPSRMHCNHGVGRKDPPSRSVTPELAEMFQYISPRHKNIVHDFNEDEGLAPPDELTFAKVIDPMSYHHPIARSSLDQLHRMRHQPQQPVQVMMVRGSVTPIETPSPDQSIIDHVYSPAFGVGGMQRSFNELMPLPQIRIS